MIVIVDERQLVKEGYNSLFDREGVASAGFGSSEFGEWMTSAADEDVKSVRAFLIGDCGPDQMLPRKIRDRTGAPVIALSEQHSLENTLRLFESGVDDVVRKPVHIREILARISAIRRRAKTTDNHLEIGAMRIFLDGRDPEIDGQPLPLPRRERRILEYLAANSRPPRHQDPGLQRDLRHLRRRGRGERGREPHQQAAQEAARQARLRSDRFQAFPRLPADRRMTLRAPLGRALVTLLRQLAETLRKSPQASFAQVNSANLAAMDIAEISR